MKHATLTVPALALLLVGVAPARAELLYDSGPMRFDNGGFEIAGPVMVSNPFTLAHASDLTGAQVGLSVYIGSEPTTLHWSIGTAPFASDLGAGVATLANSFSSNVNDTFDAYQSSFPLSGTLGHGRYWLTLQGASSTNNVNPHWTVYWLTSSDSFSARQGVASGGYDVRIMPAESFQIFGTPSAAFVPEPAGVTLLGIGLAGLAGYGWRRRKQSAPA